MLARPWVSWVASRGLVRARGLRHVAWPGVAGLFAVALLGIGRCKRLPEARFLAPAASSLSTTVMSRPPSALSDAATLRGSWLSLSTHSCAGAVRSLRPRRECRPGFRLTRSRRTRAADPVDSVLGNREVDSATCELEVFMSQFTVPNLPTGFPIQRQAHAKACIAASACSLITAQGGTPPSQALLDALVQAGMRQQQNGFNALTAALTFLGHPLTATRYTPSREDLPSWLASQAAIHQGFLLSSRVQQGAHITVIFHDGAGNWYQADPGPATVFRVQLTTLQPSYLATIA